MKKDELILKCFSIILIGGSIVSAFIGGHRCGYRDGARDTESKYQPLLDKSIQNFEDLYTIYSKKSEKTEEDPFGNKRTQKYLS